MNSRGEHGWNQTVVLECPQAEGERTKIKEWQITESAAGAEAGLVQSGSLGIGGEFRVGFDGLWSGAVPALSCESDKLSVCETIGDMRRPAPAADGGPEAVELEAWPRIGRNWVCGSDIELFVRFRAPAGNVGPLQLDTSAMTGEDYILEVTTLEDGDRDAVFLERVPTDWFEMPYPEQNASAVRVVSLGVLAGSAGAETTSYTFDSLLTPRLLSAEPTTVHAGSQLTIEVANLNLTADGNASYLDDLRVMLGDAIACANATDEGPAGDGDGHRYTCTVAAGAPGDHRLQVGSESQGIADPASAPTIAYEASVDSMQPSSGSLAGGTLLRLRGEGLHHLSCGTVAVGGRLCTEPSAAQLESAGLDGDGLTCLTPTLDTYAPADATTWAESAPRDVTLLTPASTASEVRGTFTYARGATPLLNEVSPPALSAALSGFLELRGERLGGGRPLVSFGARDCRVADGTFEQVQGRGRCLDAGGQRYDCLVALASLSLEDCRDSCRDIAACLAIEFDAAADAAFTCHLLFGDGEVPAEVDSSAYDSWTGGSASGAVAAVDDDGSAMECFRRAQNADNEIRCFLTRSASATGGSLVSPSVWTPRLGYAAAAAQATLASQFQVHGVEPRAASRAGGVVVSIRGAGFHPADAHMHEVRFLLEDGAHLPCNVVGGSETELRCELAGGLPLDPCLLLPGAPEPAAEAEPELGQRYNVL